MPPRRTYIKCTDVAKHVLDHLDLKINSSVYKEVKKHLERCANCAAYLDSVKKTVKLYRIIPHLHIPRAVCLVFFLSQ